LLLYGTAIPLLAKSQCPDWYFGHGEPFNMCVRPLYFDVWGSAGEMMETAFKECAKDGAVLPIVRNQEDDLMYNTLAASIQYLGQILGAVCNNDTRRLEWWDGSSIDYVNTNLNETTFNLDFDCVDDDQRLISHIEYKPFSESDWWFTVPASKEDSWVLLCILEQEKATTIVNEETTTEMAVTTPPKTLNECGDYETMPGPMVDGKPCFKVYPDKLSWADAQKRCADDFGSLATINSAQENDDFWRSAVSNNVMDDVHIGAYEASEDATWKWIEDNQIVASYNNFIKGFPIKGSGKCSAMLTESSTAQWVNVDCEKLKLPFVCRRAEFSSLPSACSSINLQEGEDIHAPGFPTSGIPCELMMIVDDQSLVQLEILELEANPNVDF
ncbi:hypothetical protein PFISCL1PPCAC_29196, partial [Pristionchus fissidentatus]